MVERKRVPAGLAEIPPGPELAATLAAIDPAELSGFEAVEVLKARYRLFNHDRAQLMASMVEVGLCDPDHAPDDDAADHPDGGRRRRAEPDEFAADEIRAALVLTRRAAEAQFQLAYGLRIRLPAVLAAMDSGVLDEPRARIFLEWTSDLTREQARALCDRLLPRVGELTTGQLIEAIKKLAIAVDPEWARRRYEQAVAERKVVGSRNPDGSANLSGLNLPVDRVAEASSRIEALAKTVKRGGHPDPVDHIRAELYLAMLDGSYTGLDDETIIGLLLAGHAPSDAAHHPTTQRHEDDIKDDSDSCGGTVEDGPAGGENGTGDAPVGVPVGVPVDEPAAVRPAPAGAAAGQDESAAGPRAPRPGCGRVRGGGRELRVRLSTLLGHDRHPAELAGWGPVHAELARSLAAGMTGAQWRYVVTGADGRPTGTGLIRTRPPGARRSRPADIVELQVPAALLAELAGRSVPATSWGWLVADLIRLRPGRSVEPDEAAGPDRRAPGAALRRWLQVRDRSCVGPGCRAPARTGDLDHTHDYVSGGSTLEDNLEHLCRHDHRLKHDGGWQLHQPEPGRFLWTSRLGHTYPVRPPPVIEPLPDPTPSPRPAPPPYPPIEDNDQPILRPSPEAAEPPRPPPPPAGPDDPPPF